MRVNSQAMRRHRTWSRLLFPALLIILTHPVSGRSETPNGQPGSAIMIDSPHTPFDLPEAHVVSVNGAGSLKSENASKTGDDSTAGEPPMRDAPPSPRQTAPVLRVLKPRRGSAPLSIVPLYSKGATPGLSRFFDAHDRARRPPPKEEHLPLSRHTGDYDDLLDPGQAARSWERAALQARRSPQAPLAMLYAAELLSAAGEFAEAAGLLEQYARRWPDRTDAERRLLDAARLYHRAGALERGTMGTLTGTDVGQSQDGKASRSLDDIVRVARAYLERYPRKNADGVLEAHWLWIDALFRTGRESQARALETRLPSLLGRLQALPSLTADGLWWYGRMRFTTMERVASEARTISLNEGPSRQREAHEQRLESLKILERLLGELLELGDLEWATAGIFTLGRACQELSEAIVDVTDDDVWSMSPCSATDPLLDSAFEFYRRNLELEHRYRHWNRWIELTYQELHRLRPDSYVARKRELLGAPVSASSVYRVVPDLAPWPDHPAPLP